MPKDRPGARTVDLGRLIISIRNSDQTCIAEEGNQRRPVPHVHEHYCEPCAQRLSCVVIVETERIYQLAEKTEVWKGEDVPHGADYVPRYEQRQRHKEEADRYPRPSPRHCQRNGESQGNLDRQDDSGEQELP